MKIKTEWKGKGDKQQRHEKELLEKIMKKRWGNKE